MKSLRKILIIAIVVIISACSQTQCIINSDSKKTPFYYIGHTPENKSYQIIAHLETSGWIFTSNSELITGMTKKAEKLGADAIIDVQLGYFPHIISGIPYASGYAVKWK